MAGLWHSRRSMKSAAAAIGTGESAIINADEGSKNEIQEEFLADVNVKR